MIPILLLLWTLATTSTPLRQDFRLSRLLLLFSFLPRAYIYMRMLDGRIGLALLMLDGWLHQGRVERGAPGLG